MSRTQKTYTLGKIKQLVDLNGAMTNFDLNFSVTSKTGADFDAVVVDQTRLDSDDNIQYEKANGSISGNITNDKGVYQNYFLLLKSDVPTEVDIVIDVKEIPRRIEHVQQPPPSLSPPKKQSPVNWKVMTIFATVVIVGGLYYYINVYKKKQKTASNFDIADYKTSPAPSPSLPSPIPLTKAPQLQSPSPSPSHSSSRSSPPQRNNFTNTSSLLSRLSQLA